MERGARQRKNNYWIWVVSLTMVVVLAAVWYFTRTDHALNANQNENVNAATAVNMGNLNELNSNAITNNANASTNQNVQAKPVKYSNAENHFSLSYPASWNKTTSVTGSGTDRIFSLTLNDPKHSAVSASVSVMDDSLEGQVKNSISISTEKTVTINGQSAQRLTGGSAKDGTPVTLVLFKKGGTLYSLRGSGQDFENIVNSFEMI